MINKISFAGRVFLAGSTKCLTKKSEKKALQSYADKKECDVVVLDRDYYSDGTGKFSTLLVTVDKTTGNNEVKPYTFDFAKILKGKKHKVELDYLM